MALIMSETPSFGQTSPPVRVLHRTIACRNSKWTVYFDHIADTSGAEVRDFIVVGGESPRPDLVTGICVLPVLDGKVGLIRYYRHPVEVALWEVPRGFIDAGEQPSEAALRELAEETGLSCAPENLVPLGYYLPEPSTMRARGAVFAATACRSGPRPAHEELGLGEITFFSIEEVAEMAARSAVQDASSLIAFYRYTAWLGTAHTAA
jgi:ADP-ribose pyrophosphatase YjhB (NUDIX family)